MAWRWVGRCGYCDGEGRGGMDSGRSERMVIGRGDFLLVEAYTAGMMH